MPYQRHYYRPTLKEWVLLMTPGDGNCLYNSVSISLVGDTKLASLLMLTVAELFAHSEFYAKHPQLEDFAQAARYTLPSLIIIFLSHKKQKSLSMQILILSPK